MGASELTALGAVIASAIGAIFLGVRNLRSDKFKHEVEQGAQLLSGYSTMVADLRHQIADLRAQNAQDREAAQQREVELRERHAQELRDLNERIDELSTQVWALQHRARTTRERETDQ